MKKNDHLLTYMKEYTKTILSNSVLCTDYFNNQHQHQEFRENRHEQSITSILRKKMGRKWQILHNYTYLAGGLLVIHFYWSVKSELIEPIIYILIFATLLFFRKDKIIRWFK